MPRYFLIEKLFLSFSTKNLLIFEFLQYAKSTSNIFEVNLVLYCILAGLVIAKLSNRLVVAHMSRSFLGIWDSIMIGPFALGLNQYFNTFIPELALLVFCIFYCAINLMAYSHLVCSQICDFLHIRCFTISPPPIPQSSSRADLNAPSRR